MNAFLLLALVLGVSLVRWLLGEGAWRAAGVVSSTPSEAIFVSGVLIIGSYLSGELVARVRLPRITGYLLFGVLSGPWLLGIASEGATMALERIDALALGVIAFSAGGELKLKELRARFKSLAIITGAQSAISYAALAIVVAIALQVVDLGPRGWAQMLGVALLFAVFAVPKSPATTIAVLLETRARGPLTGTVLGVTILKDVVSIVLFALVLVLVRPLILAHESVDVSMFWSTLWDLVGSVIFGALLGGLAILYLRFVRSNLPVFALGLAFFTMELARVVGLHSPLLMGIVVGFVIENASREGDRFIRGLQASTLPIFMIFFAASGARLNLGYLEQYWPLAALFVGARAAAIYVSTDLAARIAEEPPVVRRYLWTGFLSQAGVSLGFVALIRESFKEAPWIDGLCAIVLSAIIVNQIAGPPILKWGLNRAGEVPDDDL